MFLHRTETAAAAKKPAPRKASLATSGQRLNLVTKTPTKPQLQHLCKAKHTEGKAPRRKANRRGDLRNGGDPATEAARAMAMALNTGENFLSHGGTIQTNTSIYDAIWAGIALASPGDHPGTAG